MIKKSKSWMLRNIYDWDCKEETNFWFIIKDYYSIDDYSKKTRKYLKKANNRFEYRIISKELLSEQGYQVYLKAFSKYKVDDGFKQTREQFLQRIDDMQSCIDIWGAIDKETGQLEAYSICKRFENIVEFESSKANPAFLTGYYVLYGLYNARNHFYLEKQKMNLVISSARSITEHSNIQNFLLDKFCFRKAFCRIELYYTPWLKLLVNILYPFRTIIKYAPIHNLLKFEEIIRQK